MGDFNSGYPNMHLASFMVSTMKQYGDLTAVVDADTGFTYTYRQVIDRSQRLAAGLRNLGFCAGDVLGILTHNCVEHPVVYLATLLLGGIYQPLSPLYTDDDLVRRFQTCNTKILITTPEQGKRIERIVHSIKLKNFSFSKPNILAKTIVLGDLSNCISYNELLGEERVTNATELDPKTTTAILLSSSGTTGLPKAVQLSHFNIVANAFQLQEVYKHKPGMTCLAFLPMYHHFGAIPVLTVGLCSGLRIVVMPQFNFNAYLKYIEKYKAEILHMVPPVAVRLVKEVGSKSRDLSTVKSIHSGAAPLSIEVESKLMKMFNVSFIGTTFGLTETGCITGGRKDGFKPGSTGRPTAATQFKVLDLESGRNLGPSKTGELCVKGPQVTIGYLNNPGANRDAFDKDGYFHTGDIGYIDEEGYVFVVDRLKELIKYKGLQVAPAELENILLKHPDVSDAAVVGIPDNESGELPKAFIVRKPESALTCSEESLCQYVADQVAGHMRLRGGVEFINEIPKSPSGKILRRLLRQRKTSSKL